MERYGANFFSALGKLILSHLSQHITPQINLASSSGTQKSCGPTKCQLLPCRPATWRSFPKILAVKVMGNPELNKVPFQQRPRPQLQLLLTYSWLPPLHCRSKKLGLVCLFFGELNYSAGPAISCKGVVPLRRTSLHHRLPRDIKHTHLHRKVVMLTHFGLSPPCLVEFPVIPLQGDIVLLFKTLR